MNWGGLLNDYAGDLRVSGCLSGNLTGNFEGDLVFIDFLYFGGAIQDEIVGTGGEFTVRAASVASGGHITCRKGDLTSLEVASGSLLGDVKCWEGEITAITVNGDIGTISSSPKIWSAKDIILISGDDVYADIFPGAYVGFGTNRTLDQLVTTGDLGGFARTLGFTTMSIGGSLVGTLALKGSAPFPSGKTITIGDSLASTGKIEVSTAGALGGQVIVNKDNVSGSWASGGEVVINPSGTPVVLTGATYAPLSSTLGGGAVGLAKFNLHDEDCEPENGDSVASVPGNSILLRFYGPVAWGDSPLPVIVDYRPASQPNGSWTDISEDFEVVAGSNAREMLVVPTTSMDFDIELQYRVRPRTSTSIWCVGVTGTPGVETFEYIIQTTSW